MNTVSISVTESAYMVVSDGENSVLVQNHSTQVGMRVHVGAALPAYDTNEYIVIRKSLSLDNTGGSKVYVRGHQGAANGTVLLGG